MINIILNNKIFNLEEEFISIELYKKIDEKNTLIINDNNIKEENFNIYLNFIKDSTIIIPFNEYKNIKYIIKLIGPKILLKILKNKKINEKIKFNSIIYFNDIKYYINFEKFFLKSKLYQFLYLNNKNQIFKFKNNLINKENFEFFLKIIYYYLINLKNLSLEIFILFDLFQCLDYLKNILIYF